MSSAKRDVNRSRLERCGAEDPFLFGWAAQRTIVRAGTPGINSGGIAV